MATRFELVLHGENPASVRAAGEEALAEIERIERELSPFQPQSQIAHINARAGRDPVRVHPEVFRLLRLCRDYSEQTDGRFDITVGPLMRCWGLRGGELVSVPTPKQLAEARAICGMQLLEFDESNFSVRLRKPGATLDLGAVGKGYAIERAGNLLREAGISQALLHGGTSTVYAIGHPPGANAWKVAVHDPSYEQGTASPSVLCTVELRDQALSVSAVWGKQVTVKGKNYGHVLDPKTGKPAAKAALAAVVLDSATESDAYSTALLALGATGVKRLAQSRPGIKTLVLEQDRRGVFRLTKEGFPDKPPLK